MYISVHIQKCDFDFGKRKEETNKHNATFQIERGEQEGGGRNEGCALQIPPTWF